jgi:hypothetical protein
MIAALLIEDVDRAARVQEPLGEAADAVEVPEVQLIHLDAVDPGEDLLGVRPAAGRHDDVRAGAGERPRGLQPEAGVAAGDDREPPVEVDAVQDLGRRAAGAEARVDVVLWGGHRISLGRTGFRSSDRGRCAVTAPSRMGIGRAVPPSS